MVHDTDFRTWNRDLSCLSLILSSQTGWDCACSSVCGEDRQSTFRAIVLPLSCRRCLKWVSDHILFFFVELVIILWWDRYESHCFSWIVSQLVFENNYQRNVSPSILQTSSSGPFQAVCSLDEATVHKRGASALVRFVFVLSTDGWQSPPKPSATSSEAANPQTDSSRRRE